ncbi:hypothetical protein A2890_02105 [candidate division WWE3 bacterium RIFCSPLOWO2_01_FULL_53_14]|uniref:Peptidyl-prolyl cis-trans isomerase n=1 Tax=candidate division WWE3 bacterium RIFCSPLOWO2_01_FULL_53_14 TaxID=1802628 RepID=A0A1F4VRK2_UNCKA|nr:MAG: hypothetical protein A2890_02105 [candidate division WWE3 bacterium RIFCSPLOWO2_01_FULL_53_14]
MERPMVLIDTSLGNMIFELYPEVAPETVANFLKLAESGFWEEGENHASSFYRVVPGFVAQGGPLNGDDEPIDGTPIKGEFGPIGHDRGVLSMARAEDPNSASCHFFICLAMADRLDGKYASFGRLITGEDVLHEIEMSERTDGLDGKQSWPVDPIKIQRVRELWPSS